MSLSRRPARWHMAWPHPKQKIQTAGPRINHADLRTNYGNSKDSPTEFHCKSTETPRNAMGKLRKTKEKGSGLHSRSGSPSVSLAPSVIWLVTEMAEMGGKTTTAFLFSVFFLVSSKTSTANVAVAVVSETMAAVAVVSPPASGTPPWPRLADDGPVAGGVQGPKRRHLHGHRGRRWLLFFPTFG